MRRRYATRRQPQRHASAKRVSQQDDRTFQALAQISADQVGVGLGVPIRGGSRRVAETRQVDEVNRVRVLEEDPDAAKTLAAGAPAVQEDQMASVGGAERFIDECASAMREFAGSGRQSSSKRRRQFTTRPARAPGGADRSRALTKVRNGLSRAERER